VDRDIGLPAASRHRITTLATGEALDHATPCTAIGPGAAQSPRLAITDFTLRSVTGIMSFGSMAVPGATHCVQRSRRETATKGVVTRKRRVQS
jgi:hypothetical protein